VSCAIEFEFASVAFTFADFVIVTFVIVIVAVVVVVIEALYSFNVRQCLKSQYFFEKLARIVSVSTIGCDRV